MHEFPIARRDLIGAVTISAVAGCLSRTSGVRLGNVLLWNATHDEQTIVVRIDAGEDRMFEEAFTIEPTSDVRIDRTWDDTYSTYSILTQTAGEERIREKVLPDESVVEDGDCTDVEISIMDDETVIFPHVERDWGLC